MLHAPLPASGAPVWGHCSGSVVASRLHPSGETQQTRDGDAAHWVCSESLEGWNGAKLGNSWEPSDYIGRVAPNGVVVTDAHTQGAQVYVGDVISTLKDVQGGREALVVERRVNMPTVHPDNWGTPDARAYVADTIFMWDYKNGHSEVKAFENFQLADYLEGVRLETGAVEWQTNVDARIVQPNAYSPDGPVDSWVLPLNDLRPITQRLKEQAAEVYSTPTLTTGGHCRYCPARIHCPALREAGYNLIDIVKAPVNFEKMGGGDLAVERAILQGGLVKLKARLEAIDDELMHQVKKGDASSGLSLQSKPGRLKWTVSPSSAIAAVGLLGVDISKTECDTPAQARAKVPAKMRAAFDEGIKGVSRRGTSLALVPTADTLAAKVFTKKG